MIVSSDQIDRAEFEQYLRYRPIIENTHTRELCRKLILWVWSRVEDQVVISKKIFEIILEVANKLSHSFSEQIPIVDKGSMRLKVARLAVALAGRTFSTTEDMQSIEVKECHVRFIDKFLRRVYCDTYFGYDDYSQSVKISSEVIQPEEIIKEIGLAPHPKDLVQNMLHTEKIDFRDVCDWCEWSDYKDAQKFLSLCVRKHALVREKGSPYYRKSSGFTRMLKKMLLENNFGRPSHIKGKF
jgi:hypothetical protein